MTEKDSLYPAPSFKPLGPSIFLHTPPDHAPAHLVIIATWLGAGEKHIAKYTSAYSRLIPNAKIMLIKGTMDGLFSSYASQRKAMQPAAQAIHAILEEASKEKPHVLLHIFSMTGANSITNLAHAFHQMFARPLPLVGLLVDSACAAGGWKQTYTGFMRSLPDNILVKILGHSFITTALIVVYSSVALGRYEDPEQLWRNTLLDEELLGVRDENDKKRICYFASKRDQTTPWHDVVSHSELAKTQGWDVKLFLWEDTPHCNHMPSHEDEYTQAIKDIWAKAKL